MRYKKLTRSFATMRAVDKNGNVINEVQTSNTQQQQVNGTTGAVAPPATPKGQPVQLSIDFGAAQPQANPQPQAAPTTQTGPTLVDFGAPVDNQAQQAVNAGQQQTQATPPPTDNTSTQQQMTPPPIPDSYTDAQGNRINNGSSNTQQQAQANPQPQAATSQTPPPNDPGNGSSATTTSQPRSILNPVSLADLRKQSGTGAVPADKKKSWWEKFVTKRIGNSAAKYYKNNGQSVAGGLGKQLLKNIGGLAATGALTAATGGLGLVGGRLINSSIRNSNTSLQNARREGQMRDAYAKQLKELMNARKTGKISDDQYISMRNSALANMKQEKAKIHDIAQNGRSIINPTEGASRVGNFFRRFLPFNRNKAAINYIDQTKDNTKWLQQQKNGQYNNNGEYLNNGGYRYNNN